MKTKIFLAMLLAVIMSACSDGPEDRGRVDNEFINALSRDGSVSTFRITDFRTYEKDTVAGSEWVEYDYNELTGVEWPFGISSLLCFQDGRLWEPVDTYSDSEGPYKPCLAWQIYSKATGVSKRFYVRSKFTYDESRKIMKIGKHEFSVVEFTENSLRLQLESRNGGYDFLEERWICTGYDLFTYEYKAAEPIRFDGDDIMAFDSNAECYRYMVKMAREKFGRYINLDEVYKDLIYLENPILDLDEVEKWIDEYEQKNK